MSDAFDDENIRNLQQSINRRLLFLCFVQYFEFDD